MFRLNIFYLFRLAHQNAKTTDQVMETDMEFIHSLLTKKAIQRILLLFMFVCAKKTLLAIPELIEPKASMDLNERLVQQIQLMGIFEGLMESVMMEYKAQENVFVAVQNLNPHYSVNLHQENRSMKRRKILLQFSLLFFVFYFYHY